MKLTSNWRNQQIETSMALFPITLSKRGHEDIPILKEANHNFNIFYWIVHMYVFLTFE